MSASPLTRGFCVILHKSDHTYFTEIFGYTYISNISMKVRQCVRFACLLSTDVVCDSQVFYGSGE